jgi:hypothetical protein
MAVALCNFDNDNMLCGSLYKSKLVLRNLIVVKGWNPDLESPEIGERILS